MSKIPRWLPVGEHGAVLKDAAGLILGSVQRHDLTAALWVGTALYSASCGSRQYTDSKEKAMEFVTKTLTEHGRL